MQEKLAVLIEGKVIDVMEGFGNICAQTIE